jgi:hypothetical protein
MGILLDTFDGAAGDLIEGRIANTGQTWHDLNDAARLDGLGNLIRRPSHDDPYQVGPGVYCDIHLDGNALNSMEATASWLDVSGDGTGFDTVQKNPTVTLICAADPARQGPPGSSQWRIYDNCVHASFGSQVTTVYCYQGGSIVSGTSFSWQYTQVDTTGATNYDLGMFFNDTETITFKLPGQTTLRTATHPLFKTLAGPHLIYQTYNTVAPKGRPRISVARAESKTVGGVTPTPIRKRPALPMGLRNLG